MYYLLLYQYTANWLLLCEGIIMLLNYSIIDFHLFYDGGCWYTNMSPSDKSLILRWPVRPVSLFFNSLPVNIMISENSVTCKNWSSVDTCTNKCMDWIQFKVTNLTYYLKFLCMYGIQCIFSFLKTNIHALLSSKILEQMVEIRYVWKVPLVIPTPIITQLGLVF